MTKRTSIDFRPARGSERTDLVCTVLKYCNASGLILKAFKSYRPAQPESVTAMTDMDTRIKAFIDRYNINERNDVISVLQKEPFSRDIELAEPGEKNISYSDDDAAAQDMIMMLERIRYRDRGIIVTKIVHQYLANGNNEYYNELTAKLLFNWLKEEMSEPEEIRDPAAEVMIVRIAATAEEKEARLQGKAGQGISDDDFRRLIGIKVSKEDRKSASA